MEKGYTLELGHVASQQWLAIMRQFKDMNLYQAYAYDVVRYGHQGVEHLVLKSNGLVVAAAQARVVRVPMLKAGIAYVRYGPMWRLSGQVENAEIFRQAIRALRNEFSCRRGFAVRLFPLAYREQDNGLVQILQGEGFRIHDAGRTKRTLIVELEPTLEKLRASLDQKWRNCLNRAEKNGLELVIGESEAMFSEFERAFKEMIRRKKLSEPGDLDHLKKVQALLPPDYKLKIVLCRRDNELCAGAVFAAIGMTGIYLFGATTNVGMKTNGSYAVQWEIMKWLKERGFKHYDLNGINPVTNPGTYRFKSGLSGKMGKDLELLGKFQVSGSFLSSWAVNGGESLSRLYRRFKNAFSASR